MQTGNVRVHQYGGAELALDVFHENGTSTRLVIPHSVANAIAESIQELTNTDPGPVRVYTLDKSDTSVEQTR